MSQKMVAYEDAWNLLNRLTLMMAAMVVPLIEKYGDEAMEYLKKSLREIMVRHYKRVFDQMNIEKRDLKTFGKIFYQQVVRPLEAVGQKEVVIESTDRRSVNRAIRCVELEGWRQVTDKPEILCELDEAICKAMAEAFNPKLVYKKYSAEVVDGKHQWGLPWGKPYCEFIMEDEDKKLQNAR